MGPEKMASFVLVHGAWGGAHGFRKVRGPLRAAGHEVFTPSLTGIGERAHLTSPQVGLTTHITDVVNAVLYEDLRGIVLLGFSYGGFVVTGALEHIGDRVAHLVYLDAFVPRDGESLNAATGGGTDRGVIELGRDWLVLPLPRDYDDPAEAAWASARRIRRPASPSRSGWYGRWRTTRSRAPTSRRPASPAPTPAGRSGPRPTGP
jgi:pimeloyl-ACP methyl ester carboxylesterase